MANHISSIITLTDPLFDAVKDDVSVFKLLEVMRPMLESPLLYVFPTVCIYAEACETMIEQVTKMLATFDELFTNDQWYSSENCHISWMTSISEIEVVGNERNREDRWGPVSIEPSFGHWIYHSIASRSMAMSVEVMRHQKDFTWLTDSFVLPVDELREKLMTRMKCRMSHEFSSELDDVWVMVGTKTTLDDYDKKKKLKMFISNQYGNVSYNSYLPAFDTVALKKEVDEFCWRAELKARAGAYAAEQARYTPGNEGYYEALQNYSKNKIM